MVATRKEDGEDAPKRKLATGSGAKIIIRAPGRKNSNSQRRKSSATKAAHAVDNPIGQAVPSTDIDSGVTKYSRTRSGSRARAQLDPTKEERVHRALNIAANLKNIANTFVLAADMDDAAHSDIIVNKALWDIRVKLAWYDTRPRAGAVEDHQGFPSRVPRSAFPGPSDPGWMEFAPEKSNSKADAWRKGRAHGRLELRGAMLEVVEAVEVSDAELSLKWAVEKAILDIWVLDW